MISQLEERALAKINLESLLQTIKELVAFPSLGGNETPVQDFLAEWMRRNGMQVDRWNIDMEELKKHPAFSAEIEREEPVGVVGWIGEGRGKSLIYNGHVDVVPTGDPANWKYPPYEATVADDRVYGRGAVDMKGGLACALHAVRAIQDAGLKIKGKLMVESVVGEEDGGTGALAAVVRGYHADGAVLIEPTEMAIAPVQAGALSFKVAIPGLSAHACVREEGVSAIDGFLPVYQALKDLEEKRHEGIHDPLYARYRLPYALNIGTVQAGDWPSSVPEMLVFQGRYGIIPGENMDEARRQFEETIRQVANSEPWLREHPPVVEWWGGQFAPARIPVDSPIVETLSGAFQDASGAATRLEGMTYGSDMRILVNQGNIPAVLFGPGDVRRAHKPDEFVPISDLVNVTRTLVLTALRFCGCEES